mgnify:CR=1 FL=1
MERPALLLWRHNSLQMQKQFELIDRFLHTQQTLLRNGKGEEEKNEIMMGLK